MNSRWENMKERNLFNSSESQNQKNVCSTTKNPEQELSKIQHDTFFWMHNSIIPAIRNFEPTHEPLFPEFQANFMEEHKSGIKNAWEKYVSHQENYLEDEKEIKEEQSLEETLNQLRSHQIFSQLQQKKMKEMFFLQSDWLRIFNGLHKIFDIKFNEEIDFLTYKTLQVFQEKSKHLTKPTSLSSIEILSKDILKIIVPFCSEKLEVVLFYQKFDQKKENFQSFISVFVESICCAAAGFFVNRRCGDQISFIQGSKPIKKKVIRVQHRKALEENEQARKRRKIPGQ